jgi:hypothetical protein
MESDNDIEGTWEITWTDTSNNSDTFTIHIKKVGIHGYQVDSPSVALPVDCAAVVGNVDITGESAKFTIMVMVAAMCGNFNFTIPQLGGSGKFSGSVFTLNGSKDCSGTCTSQKIS